MTKCELLLAVCEQPGTVFAEPRPGASASVNRMLAELREEGWLRQGAPGEGWFATDKALDAYPQLTERDGKITTWAEDASPPSDRRLVGVITLDGRGYEIHQDERGRYLTDAVEPGARSAGYGHFDSIRLMAQMTELLAGRLR